jgi:hypothetical protein
VNGDRVLLGCIHAGAESGQSFFADDIFVRDARPPADLALTRYGRSGRSEAF